MSRRTICATLALITVFLGRVRVEAATVEPMTLDDMARRSDFILIGRCLEVRADWNASHTRIYTYATFAVERFLKGGAGLREVTLRVLGGQVGALAAIVPGSPSFARGEEVLLFCVGGAARMPTVLGLSLGKFTLARNGNGERILKRDISGLTLADYRTDSRVVGSPPVSFRLAEVETRIAGALSK